MQLEKAHSRFQNKKIVKTSFVVYVTSQYLEVNKGLQKKLIAYLLESNGF